MIEQSNNQSINQSIGESLEQSVDQSINQSMTFLVIVSNMVHFFVSFWRIGIWCFLLIFVCAAALSVFVGFLLGIGSLFAPFLFSSSRIRKYWHYVHIFLLPFAKKLFEIKLNYA